MSNRLLVDLKSIGPASTEPSEESTAILIQLMCLTKCVLHPSDFSVSLKSTESPQSTLLHAAIAQDGTRIQSYVKL